MIRQIMDFINQCDPEVGATIESELARQKRNIELIASENIVSEPVMITMGTCLTNKYAEGYPGKRYYGGCEEIDVTERIARERACKLFGADHANVQPGDTVLGMSLNHGGHLSHGSPVNISGSYFKIVSYGLDDATECIDYDEVEALAKKHSPKLIVAGASAYPRAIDFKRFRQIADSCGAYLMVDMAHIAGLVAAGLHENPVPYADVVTSTTHKTLRGPRGGLILCKESLAKQIDKAVFPGTQGGPLMHTIAAKAVCFGEALKPEFKTYQEQVVKNAKALAEGLLAEGFRLVSGGTDNHLMLVDLRPFDITGKAMEKMLDEVYITANKNSIPHDPQKPTVTSGIRVGTPAVTSRGFKEEEMKQVASMLGRVARDFEGNCDAIREEVKALCARFPIYE